MLHLSFAGNTLKKKDIRGGKEIEKTKFIIVEIYSNNSCSQVVCCLSKKQTTEILVISDLSFINKVLLDTTNSVDIAYYFYFYAMCRCYD